jgi:drug/metabolite transporter (DMT)-like permease
VVLLNATVGVSLYVRAVNLHGAAAVSMLFCVIPAVAGVLSWLMLGQRVDLGIGVGLLLGALACWLNSSGTLKRSAPSQVEAVHQPAATR